MNLSNLKIQLNSNWGIKLDWKRNDAKISCQVSYALVGVSLYTPEDWSKALTFLATNIISLEKVMRNPLKEIKKVLNTNEDDE